TVNNVAPTVTITGVPASGHSPEGTAIALGSSVTDPSSVDTAAGFTYAWSVTKNGAAYASGTTASLSFTPDDNASYAVTVTAKDKDGGTSRVSNSVILVDNVAATASLANNGPVAPGATVTVTFSNQSDPSSVDAAAGFRYSYDFNNDGTFEVSNSTSA